MLGVRLAAHATPSAFCSRVAGLLAPHRRALRALRALRCEAEPAAVGIEAGVGVGQRCGARRRHLRACRAHCRRRAAHGLLYLGRGPVGRSKGHSCGPYAVYMHKEAPLNIRLPPPTHTVAGLQKEASPRESPSPRPPLHTATRTAPHATPATATAASPAAPAAPAAFSPPAAFTASAPAAPAAVGPAAAPAASGAPASTCSASAQSAALRARGPWRVGSHSGLPVGKVPRGRIPETDTQCKDLTTTITTTTTTTTATHLPVGTRPWVGASPITPQKAAAIRMEPAWLGLG
eukprot:scaffold42063_cov63-Phaeocystis_antarctica.AAC.1